MSGDRILHDVDAVQKFLCLMHCSDANGAAFREAEKAQAAALVAKLRKSDVTVQTAAHLVKTIKIGPWSPETLHELLEVVASATTAPTCSNGNGTQDFTNVADYLTAKVWELLKGNSTIKTKLDHFCWFLVALGLRNPSERSMQSITAFFHLAVQGFEVCMGMSASSKLIAMRDMKRLIKTFAKTRKQVGKMTATYPPSPRDWKRMEPELYHTVYGVDEPVNSLLSHVEMTQITNGWCLRSSNAQLQSSPARSRSSFELQLSPTISTTRKDDGNMQMSGPWEFAFKMLQQMQETQAKTLEALHVRTMPPEEKLRLQFFSEKLTMQRAAPPSSAGSRIKTPCPSTMWRRRSRTRSSRRQRPKRRPFQRNLAPKQW